MALSRVILITGASAGIGRATAVGLSKAFPSPTHPEPLVLALVGRRKEELEKTAQMCREGTTTEVLTGDVSVDADVDRIFQTIKDKYGRLDVLFNVSRPAPLTYLMLLHRERSSLFVLVC